MRAIGRRRSAKGAAAVAMACATAATCWVVGAVPFASGASNNLFAKVSAAGGKQAGNGVTSISHVSTGQYEVTFNRDVSGCAYVATTRNAFSQAIQVFPNGGHSSVNGVFVEVKNQGGGLTDGPFDLTVDCGGTGQQFAVVGYGGTLARATSGTTITSVGTGQYRVTFPASVKSCAYLASVGDPGSGLALAPNNVSTGSGPDDNTVYVETKNPGGGLTSGIPFHLVTLCSGVPNIRYAVVGDTGIPVRTSPLTSSFSPSTGNFTLADDRSVSSACAAIATRGSTTSAVPFNPGTVEIASGPAANTMNVQTRELLNLGGNPFSLAFHAALVC